MDVHEKNTEPVGVRLAVAAIHILCWLIFLSLPGIFNPRLHGVGFAALLSDLSEPSRWSNGLLLIIVFYLNYIYAIPGLYFRRRYVAYAFTAGLCFTAFVMLNYLQRPDSGQGGARMSPLGNSFNLFMFLIVYLVSFVLCISERWRRYKDELWGRRMAVVTERLSPHILFNTLNSIYALSLAKSEEVPAAIVKLSHTLRYTMDDGHSEVQLDKEIEFVRNFIDLEKMRLPQNIQLSFSVGDNLPAIVVPRFLFLPLVEGIVRSVQLNERDSILSIAIRRVNNELVTHVEGVSEAGEDVHTTLNIARLREQFELHFPGNYSLELSFNGHIFVVVLRIRLS